MLDDISDVRHDVVSAITALPYKDKQVRELKICQGSDCTEVTKCPIPEIGRDDTVGESYKQYPDPVRRMEDGDSGSLTSKVSDLGDCQSSKEIWTS